MRIFFSCLALLLALFLVAACSAGIVLTILLATVEPAIEPEPLPPIVVPAPMVPTPEPDCPDCQPKPEPDKPKQPRKPWGPHGCQSVGLVSGYGFAHDGPVHDGQEVQIDLPADILKRNIGSPPPRFPGDPHSLGCCVFRSLNYCGLYNNAPELIDLPEKMVKAGIEGGGHPKKVDEIMKRFAPNVKYMQVQNGDWNVVKLALRTGHCVAITHQPGHMVCIVCLTDTVGCFRDNNKVGPNELIWGTAEAIKQKAGGKNFWAVILLNGRPPAPPRSQHAYKDSPDLFGIRALRPHLDALTPHRPFSRRGSTSLVQLEADGPPGLYEWRDALDGEQWPLFRNGQQVGAFVPEWNSYRERTGPGQWGKVWRRPPVPLPEDALAKLEDMPPGVCQEHLAQGACYSICGQEVSREQATAALEDDSTKLSLTAIGSKQETARVRADLDRPEMAAFKAHVIFQEYTPDDWAISQKRFGFDTSGKPSVYLEQPDGTVLYHTNDFRGAETMTKLRKADPNYRPDADPGMPKAPKPVSPNAVSEWGAVSIGVCVLSLAVFGLALLALAAVSLWHLLDSFIGYLMV